MLSTADLQQIHKNKIKSASVLQAYLSMPVLKYSSFNNLLSGYVPVSI